MSTMFRCGTNRLPWIVIWRPFVVSEVPTLIEARDVTSNFAEARVPPSTLAATV
jgi:hypothetical protein